MTRQPRLGFLSFLWRLIWPGTLLVLAALFAVICFGGTLTAADGGFVGWWESWVHGWPWVFLERGTINDPSHRFALWHGDHQLSIRPLLADIGIYCLIIGTIAVGPRLLGRWRKQPRQAAAFSLAHMFVVITLLCLALGTISRASAVSRTERQIGKRLDELGNYVTYKYVGPVWLARLLGTHTMPWPLDGVATLRLWVTSHDHVAGQIVSADVSQLRHLQFLDCSRTGLTDAGLETILTSLSNSRLSSICFADTKISGKALRKLADTSTLTSIDANQSTLDDAGFATLARLRSVESINASHTKITRRSLDEALQMPNLKFLTLQGLGFTEEDCAGLVARGVECQW